MVFREVEDPFKDSVITWGEGNLYFRLKYLPMGRKWYLRLDKIEFGQDNVLKEWDIVKGDLKSKTRAINKALKIITEFRTQETRMISLLNI